MTKSSDPIRLFTIDGLSETTAVFDLIRDGDPFSSVSWTVHQFVAAFGIRASAEKRSDAPIHYWPAFLNEFKLFLCSKDKKYASLRRELASIGEKSQAALVSVIAASIGACIGAIGTVIAPLVTISLIVVIRVSKEAFCRMQKIDIDTYRPFDVKH